MNDEHNAITFFFFDVHKNNDRISLAHFAMSKKMVKQKKIVRHLVRIQNASSLLSIKITKDVVSFLLMPFDSCQIVFFI